MNKNDHTIIKIDTSQRDVVSVVLIHKNEEYPLHETMTRTKAQVVLPMLKSLLKDQGLAIEDIEAIEVNIGPGSFTGLRVGVAIANTLGTILKIPVNGKPVLETVEPTYQ